MVIHIKCNILTRPFLFSSLLNVSSLKFQIQLQFPHTYHTPGADPENFQTGVATEVIAYLCPKGGVDTPPPLHDKTSMICYKYSNGEGVGMLQRHDPLSMH